MGIYVGLNIQFPISNLILSGRKTIETRTYPLSEKYLNKDLVMIETPGKTGNFKSRAIAIIRISKCFKYNSKKEFYADSDKHFVTELSEWAWMDRPKFGWVVEVIKKLDPPQTIEKPKGIIYTTEIEIKE